MQLILAFNRNILYCKYVEFFYPKQFEVYLIGTFCIVNIECAVMHTISLKFNRNILYCKCIYCHYSVTSASYLIGTFCIVNKLGDKIKKAFKGI